MRTKLHTNQVIKPPPYNIKIDVYFKTYLNGIQKETQKSKKEIIETALWRFIEEYYDIYNTGRRLRFK